MFDVENKQELVEAILKDKPADEQIRILKDLFINHALCHGWADEELVDNIMSNVAREYGLKYSPINDESEDIDINIDESQLGWQDDDE